MTSTPDAELIERAALALEGVATSTPLERNRRLSEQHGAEVWLKREDLQLVRSYKVRGAYFVLSTLTEEQRARGVVCASAGNHAQGVALACAQMKVQGRVYVPRNTPRQKRQRIAVLGGEFIEVVVFGDNYDEAAAMAAEDAGHTGATMIPPFDDPRTIAGQGTVVIEIIDQMLEATGWEPDLVVVPVGGGGLLAGCATWLRERYPNIDVVGVEPSGAACLTAALQAGRPVTLNEIDTFVDGAAVRRAGDVTFPIIRDLKAPVVTVEEGQVCIEMLDLYQSEGIVAEPAGALAPAALASAIRIEPGTRVVCVLSGGNNDVSRYAEVVERALVQQGRKHYFLVEFPQEPGALRRFLDQVLGPDDDITRFEYVKRNNRETGPALVGIELASADDLRPLLQRMATARLTIEPVDASSPFFGFLI